MKYKTFIIAILLLCSFAIAQEQKTVSIPEDKLTEQQKAEYLHNGTPTPQEIHSWTGMGKEIGEAISSSLSAVTTQTNNFAQTGVGKVTIALVVWKVLGNDALHFVAALVELMVFLPLFIWSYRKMCMDRKVVVSREGFFGKKTWQIIPYSTGHTDFTPRVCHLLVIIGFVIIWLLTFFAG